MDTTLSKYRGTKGNNDNSDSHPTVRDVTSKQCRVVGRRSLQSHRCANAHLASSGCLRQLVSRCTRGWYNRKTRASNPRLRNCKATPLVEPPGHHPASITVYRWRDTSPPPPPPRAAPLLCLFFVGSTKYALFRVVALLKYFRSFFARGVWICAARRQALVIRAISKTWKCQESHTRTHAHTCIRYRPYPTRESPREFPPTPLFSPLRLPWRRN